MNCPECREVMARFIDGGVDGKTRKEVGLHLADCPECMRLIEGGKFWDDAVLKLLDHEAPADLRSEILGDLGEGGLDDLGWKKQLKIVRWASTRNNSPRLWLQAAAWAAGLFLIVEFGPTLWSGFRPQPYTTVGPVTVIAGGQVLSSASPLESESLSLESRLF